MDEEHASTEEQASAEVAEPVEEDSEKRTPAALGYRLACVLINQSVEPPTVRNLAQALGTHAGYLRRTLRRLVEEGLVTTTPGLQRGTPPVILYWDATQK